MSCDQHVMHICFVTQCYNCSMETIVAHLCQPPYLEVIILNSGLSEVSGAFGLLYVSVLLELKFNGLFSA